MTKIYLDNNATTNLLPEAQEKVLGIMGSPLNASSLHFFGRKAKSILEDAKHNILNSLNGDKSIYEVVFTSSGTEANNLVIQSFMHQNSVMLVSSIEHISILETAKLSGISKTISVHPDGLLNFNDLEQKLAQIQRSSKNESPPLVSVMLANNETGVIQNIKEIARISHKYGCFMHSDIVQAFGKISIDISDLDIDFATISSHKMGGMIGSAALIKRKNLKINPMIFGGGQEKFLRAGTENIPSILSFGIAASLSQENILKYKTIETLRDYLEKEIQFHSSSAKIYSQNATRLPNTTCVATTGKDSSAQLMYFDISGIAISSGSACSSGKIESSHVLHAMDYHDTLSSNAIRVSMGLNTTKDEIDIFLKAWKELQNK